MKKSSFRCSCLGVLISPDNSVTNNWIPLADQILLTVSLIFAYLAGVVPRDGAFSRVRNGIAGSHSDAATSSNGRSFESVSTNYWHGTREKLIDALSTINDNGDINNKDAESDNYSKKRPFNMFAINKGPKLRLILVALEQLQKEVNDISESNEFVTHDIWLEVSSEVLKRAIVPVYKKWLEVELNLENGECNMILTSKILGKLKGDDRILQNINRLGKSELYSDLIFFLRFGSFSAGCCYDTKLLMRHGVDILEDLIVTLADTIASIYLELISIDSDISTEMNDSYSALCSMSTRALQKLRNEVVLNQWLQENFESVTSMYEDRFELHILCRELLDNPIQSQNDSVDWWKKLPFRKSAIKSSLPYVHISPFSLPLRRTKELRALTGWRYYFSLYLEFCDIGMPIVRAVFTKVRDAISFLLVCMIGRSVGLIFSGIRQSLGWR
ncbi:hypothetical protein Cni_G28095 [Canna indica]|uniref:DUF3685 domain-containing protein n=1 Tax=Canna indica TaxID=4628 RepID=A0AAQ3L508_9LILI|nr:hypothetical protein Cni_G28095 [Canna indica]